MLKLGGWRNRAAIEAARRVTHFMLGGEQPSPELYAANEEILQRNKVRMVISGHTHDPKVALLKSDKTGERYYINTGTFRSVIPSTPDRRTFGRMDALTYVMLFSEEEQKARGEGSRGSFDYWNGFSHDF